MLLTVPSPAIKVWTRFESVDDTCSVTSELLDAMVERRVRDYPPSGCGDDITASPSTLWQPKLDFTDKEREHAQPAGGEPMCSAPSLCSTRTKERAVVAAPCPSSKRAWE